MAEEENKDVPYFRATSWMGEAGDTVYERIRDPAWLSGEKCLSTKNTSLHGTSITV
jgi:hypothetical protein